MGNRWNVGTADTTAKHVHVTLQFTDEEGSLEAGGGGIRQRTQHLKRFVELDVQFKDEDQSCVIQLDFNLKTEGLQYDAADFVVQDIKEAIERELGPGVAVGTAEEFKLDAPPWWLLGITACALLALCSDVFDAVFK